MYRADISSAGAFHSNATAIKFWRQKEESKVYSVLPLTAHDLVSSSALQAFVETYILACGMLTAGRCNSLDKSLKMRAWFRLK